MSILKSALRTVFKPILPQLRYARRRWSRPHFAKAQRASMLRRLDPKHPRFDAFTDYAFSTVSRGEEAVAMFGVIGALMGFVVWILAPLMGDSQSLLQRQARRRQSA